LLVKDFEMSRPLAPGRGTILDQPKVILTDNLSQYFQPKNVGSISLGNFLLPERMILLSSSAVDKFPTVFLRSIRIGTVNFSEGNSTFCFLEQF
jgi:hypothetical protein